MWLKKAIVFTGLPIETTQNGYPLEEKYLCEFSRVQYTPHVLVVKMTFKWCKLVRIMVRYMPAD